MTAGTLAPDVPAVEKPTIFELFADVKRQVGPVGKGSYNQQHDFRFRSVDAVVNAAAAALDEHGVITVPVLQDIAYGTVEVGWDRTKMAHVQVKVAYRFYGPRGDCFEAVVPAEAMDSGDKATAKAMSVAYRIALIQALNLPTGDPDPDEQVYERSSAPSAGGAFDEAASRHPGRTEGVPGRPREEQPAAGARQDAPAGEPRPDSLNGRWVSDFRDSLASASEPAQLDGKRGVIGHALARRIITVEVAGTLTAELGARRRELEEAVPAP